MIVYAGKDASGTLVEHPTFIDVGMGATTRIVGGQGTVVARDGPSEAAGTYVQMGTSVLPASGTFVVGGGAGAAAASAAAGPKGASPDADYMAALRIAEEEEDPSRPPASGAQDAGPLNEQQREARARVDALKAKLRKQAESLDNIDLPLMRALYAAPMALMTGSVPLRPPVPDPAEDGDEEEAAAARAACLSPVERGIITEVLEQMGAAMATRPAIPGSYGGVPGTPGSSAMLSAYSQDQLPAAVERKVLLNPTIGSLARMIAYYRCMLRDLVLTTAEQESVRAIMTDLEKGLRTLLKLGAQ